MVRFSRDNFAELSKKSLDKLSGLLFLSMALKPSNAPKRLSELMRRQDDNPVPLQSIRSDGKFGQKQPELAMTDIGLHGSTEHLPSASKERPASDIETSAEAHSLCFDPPFAPSAAATAFWSQSQALNREAAALLMNEAAARYMASILTCHDRLTSDLLRQSAGCPRGHPLARAHAAVWK